VPKATQQTAVKWLLANAFANVDWLINREVVTHHMMGYTDRIRSLQASPLNRMLSFETFARLDNSGLSTANAYKTVDLCQDLRQGLWSELVTGAKMDGFRRNIQKAYVERMKYLLTEQMTPSPFARDFYNVSQSDVRSIVRGELKTLLASLQTAKGKYADKETAYHLADCIDRIQTALNPTKAQK